jgi:hypothetical protein
MYPSEQQFADFLTAQGKTYIYEPVLQLDTPCPKRGGNQTYKPDFYCPSNDTYYEVSANRQAYHQSIKKIKLLRKIRPDIKFKVVNPDGSEYKNSRDVRCEYFRRLAHKPQTHLLSEKNHPRCGIDKNLTVMTMKEMVVLITNPTTPNRMTLRELAIETGVSEMGVRGWLEGARPQNLKVRKQIIELYKERAEHGEES